MMADSPMEEAGDLIEAVPDSMDAEEAPAIREIPMAEEPKVNTEYSGTHLIRIDNYSKRSEKFYSEHFDLGTYVWRVLVFFRGQKSQGHLSVYLDAPEAAYCSPHLAPRAKFVLSLVNQGTGNDVNKEATHHFTSVESDWGFGQFFPLEEIANLNNGWLVDDTLLMRVSVDVQPDMRYSQDIRKETGFVGLKNQGATCYMNSLLQYLYSLPYFRTAVYHMPTNVNDDASASLPLALQSLFYKLQYNKTAVSTKDLTKSFGWNTNDAFMQHDVQELNRVLCEKLEEKMKGTKVERAINELFEGFTHSIIKCLNVDHESTRKESFMDLQLDVKGCKNVVESFIKYCEFERMDGQNQYKSDKHGLQDAEKGVLFGELPPVLQLQLKRFEYDYQRDMMIKINDRYEFPDVLDLDFDNRKIFSKEADSSVRNLYRLHSVLVHSGGLHGGHYYAFIRPNGTQWLKFDDDRVELTDAAKAMNDQFGWDEDVQHSSGVNIVHSNRVPKFSNAYMLVYVRESDWSRIMAEPKEEDIDEGLRARFAHEQQVKEERQKLKVYAHQYCTIKLATWTDMIDQVGGAGGLYWDLVNHDKLPAEHIFRVRKSNYFTDFKALVREKLGVPEECQRYWVWSARQNMAYRPFRPLKPEEEQKRVMQLNDFRDLRVNASKQSLMDIKLFLETPLRMDRDVQKLVPNIGAPLKPYKPNEEAFVFIKMYDPEHEDLKLVAALPLLRRIRLIELEPTVRAVGGLSEKTPLWFYEEVKCDPVSVPYLDKSKPLGQVMEPLSDGDIIIVQREVSEEEAEKLRFPTVDRFLEHMHCRRMVTFKRLEDPKEAGFTLELSKDDLYDQWTSALSYHLGSGDPSKLRTWQHNQYNQMPQKYAIKSKTKHTLEQLLIAAPNQPPSSTLYYEILEMPLEEMERLRDLKVSFYNAKAESVGEHTLRLPKDATFGAALLELKRILGPAYADKKLRMMEQYSCQLYRFCDAGMSIAEVTENYWKFRAEEVLPEEDAVVEGERIIFVCHVHETEKDVPLTKPVPFGDPFMLRIKDEEPLIEIKKRIQAKLSVPDEEFSKWRYIFWPSRGNLEYLEDDDVLGLKFLRLGNEAAGQLALQHEDKMPRRMAASRLTYEKPVKIYS